MWVASRAVYSALEDRISTKLSLANAGDDVAEHKIRGKIEDLEIDPDSKLGKQDTGSKAVNIRSKSAHQASVQQARRLGRPPFPSPSLEMVQQAFLMLDPTGSGFINPLALREVILLAFWT